MAIDGTNTHKIKVFLVINQSFHIPDFASEEDFNEYYQKTTALWYHSVFRSEESPFGDPLIDTTSYRLNKKTFMDCYSLQDMKATYKGLEKHYVLSILVFQSLDDVNHSVKRAFYYLTRLRNIGYIVYVTSLSYRWEFFRYNKKFCAVYDINMDETINRVRKPKYTDEALEYAAVLRGTEVGMVSYAIIRKYLGIPRSTLISYIHRKGMILYHGKGRDYLTKEEIAHCKYLKKNGLIYNKPEEQ